MMEWQRAWVDSEGRKYRNTFYNRTRPGGTNPLTDNPTRAELLKAIDVWAPERVLEFGCGYGRILEWIEDKYPEVYGCDVSPEMLDLAADRVACPVFWWDILGDDGPEMTWDVSFCHSVFRYFNAEQTAKAMASVSAVTRDAVLVWEWKHVCDLMRVIAAGRHEKFEFHPIERRDE